MPTAWETFPIPITGGLLTDSPPIRTGLEAPGSAIRLVNFEPSIRGGYRRINGYTKFDSNAVTAGSDSVLGVAYFYGTVVAVTDNGSISTSTGSGWTEEASGRTHNNKYRFTKINLNGTKKLIGVDGDNDPFVWDGSTVSNISGTSDVSGASHVVSFQDHVFYAKADLVTFSIPFDETDFTTGSGAGSFRVPEDVTGFYVFRDRLFIFTSNTISVLDGTSSSNFALTSVSETVGCIYPDTIVEVAGDVAFMAADGIRLLGATDRIGDFNNQVASFNIESSINKFEQQYDSFSSVSIRGKRQYRIFGYSSSEPIENSTGFIGTQYEAQNPASFQWAETLGIKVSSIDSQYYNGEEFVVFSNSDGFVYQLEEGSTFDGTEIVSSYWTPYISFSDPTYRKTLYKLNSYFKAEGNVVGTVSPVFDLNDIGKIQPPFISLDAEGDGTFYGVAVYGSSSYAAPQVSLVEKQLVGGCFNCSFQFEFQGSKPFQLDTLFVEFATEDRQ